MNDLELYDLTCEYQTNPLGVGEPSPRLAWKLRTARRGARQTAYRVRAASTKQGLADTANSVWDTGRVDSDQSIQVPYGGRALRTAERIHWQVQVWDEAGNMSTSPVAWWEMGFLQRADWEPAQWIGGPLVGGPWTTVPLPYLRRTFELNGTITRARLYVTALGLYECSMNGVRVGEDWLTPGWTDYSKRVQYQVYDVTESLAAGENVWGAILGDGWYCGHLTHYGRQVYGDRPKFFGKLFVSFDDGRTERFVTDEKWRVHYGALLGSDNYNGESYDARLEEDGWNRPGFDDRSWMPVKVFRNTGIELSASCGAPVRTAEEITPIADPTEIKDWNSSSWIYDFGQNMAGRIRLHVRGERGQSVRLRFAEMLNPDGSLYTTNLRSALQTDTYTLKGEGEEIWEPRFTYHGFRFVELSLLPGRPTRDMLTAVAMHSQMRRTGTFQCSEPLLNQLQHNIVWGQNSNFLDIPTDCPVRDERLGWLGDAQVFIRTAAFNRDIAAFFAKWLRDVTDAQSPRGAYPVIAPHPNNFISEDGGPAWADAGVIIPWTLFQCYGDKRVLERRYAEMTKFFEFLKASSKDYVRAPQDGEFWQGFGDWLALDVKENSADSRMISWQGGTPKELIGTAFFAYTADLMSRIARMLGLEQDAGRYRQEFENIRSAFQNNFVAADSFILANTQTSYVLALQFGLLPEQMRQSALQHLVHLIEECDMHLATGFVGTPYLLHVLTQGGRLDIAYQLILQRNYPSWLFPVLNGATTIWERWDGWTPDHGFQDPAMNSFNHYAYGAVGDWLYRSIGGIEPDDAEPGYKAIVLHPRPGGSINAARTTYESPYGMILSEWNIEQDTFTWHVIIPPNTTATVYVPLKAQHELVRATAGENSAIEFLEQRQDALVYRLTAGEYKFQARWA